MKSLWIFLGFGLLAGTLLVATIAGKILSAGGNDVGRVRNLSDGSTLRLERALFTSGELSYSYQHGGPLVRLIAPVLPVNLRRRLNLSGGGLAVGGGLETNLLVLTINREPAHALGNWRSSLTRLQVLDEYGNRYDDSWDDPPFGMPGATVQPWVVRAFPRRSKMIRLACLATNAEGGWTNAAEFRVPNPAWAEYPQWTPESLPATKQDGSLSVTLKRFQCGWRMPGKSGQGDAALAARRTRLVFSFAENGEPCGDWVSERLTISDATGNRWSPSVDFENRGSGWATNAIIEVYRALWPGERAWKIRAEFLRVAGFRPDDLTPAAPRNRVFEFLARPEFVDDMPSAPLEAGVHIRQVFQPRQARMAP